MRFLIVRCLLFAAALISSAGAWAGDSLLWLSAGRPTADARQAVDVLQSAADEGLDARDYDAAQLARSLAQALEGPVPGEAAQAQLDDKLTAAVQRYLADLENGRIDPRHIHEEFAVERPLPRDTGALLRDAVAAHRVAAALREAEPRVPMYAGLRRALAAYRALGDHEAWQVALPPPPGRKVVPGQPYGGLNVLARRLQALGDLPARAVVPDRLEGALAMALQGFQERHGLAPDGVLGAGTLQQLNVTPAARVRQIELAMERLRWTPLLRGPRMIVVNIPEFVLRAYEIEDMQVHVRLTMKVIVGKAMNTRTPLFDEDMRFIEFSPYWNVPPSIERAETVPRLRRDPAYFTQQGFEFVTGSGQVVTSLSAEHLDAVLHGGWRIRQRPGPQNALGDIKFVFPNRDNIYLHHTPAPLLFERDRRDFSHGCIRVQDPVALAKFVLQDEPAWTGERIRAAMEKGVSSTIALKEPLPVVIAYSTVIAKASAVYFYPDLYGHDALLDKALAQRTSGAK
ncbi:MAG: L,D-transpeptidase family protein [Ramlibacter sp.]